MNAIPSRRGFLTVIGTAAAAAAVPAIASATPAPLAENLPVGLPPAVAAPSPDDGLLRLFDEYMVAKSDYRRLREKASRLDRKHADKHPMPDVVMVQPGDAELGLPEVPEIQGQPLAYHYRIFELKKTEWPVIEMAEPPEGLQFSRGGGGELVRYEQPSPAARARADEIIAAHDKWHRARWRKSAADRAVERHRDAAEKLADRLRNKIDRKRAYTIAGLAAKAQLAALEGEDDAQFADWTLASILRDMRAMSRRGRA